MKVMIDTSILVMSKTLQYIHVHVQYDLDLPLIFTFFPKLSVLFMFVDNLTLLCGELTYHYSVDIKGFYKPIITKWYVRSMLTVIIHVIIGCT